MGEVLVGLTELFKLGLKGMDIVEQAVVLLFGLDESGHNLLDVGDTSGLPNLVERVLDDFDVLQVLVHQLSLLLVGFNDPVQSPLEDHHRVRVLCLSRQLLRLGLLSLLVLLLLVVVVLLLSRFGQRLIVALNDHIKAVLFLLKLSHNGDDLDSSLLSDSSNGQALLVLKFSLTLDLIDLLYDFDLLLLGRGKFLSHGVDFLSHGLVSGASCIEEDSLVSNDGLTGSVLQLGVVDSLVLLSGLLVLPNGVYFLLLKLQFGGLSSLDVLLALSQLVKSLPNLLLYDDKLRLLVLELMREVVHLLLQSDVLWHVIDGSASVRVKATLGHGSL